MKYEVRHAPWRTGANWCLLEIGTTVDLEIAWYHSSVAAHHAKGSLEWAKLIDGKMLRDKLYKKPWVPGPYQG
jgi:hypothetical protein